MKKAITILLLIAMTCSLFACQKTPEEAIIVPKDSERMIEAAQSESEDIPDGNSTGANSVVNQSFYEDSFYGTTNDFSVNIHAEVATPDSTALPIVRVTAAEFDDATANRFFHLLCDGTDMYTQEQFETKSMLEQQILKAKQMIENGEDTDGYVINSYLKTLQEKYKSAKNEMSDPLRSVVMTEQANTIAESKSFLVYSEYPLLQPFLGKYFGVKSSRINGDGYLSESTLSYFDSTVYPVADPILLSNATGQTTSSDTSKLSLTPLEAQRKAEQFLQDSGVTDMQVSAVYLAGNLAQPVSDSDSHPGWVADEASADYIYVVMLQRVVNGSPVVSPTIFSSVVGDSEQYGSSEWRYERLQIQLNDKGIAGVSWTAPLKVGEVIVENASLLPFSKIMELFKTMIRVKNESRVMEKETYHMATFQIDVSRITLSLQRIAEKDSVTTGLLVPVWNFWGAETRVYEDGSTVVWGSDIGNNTEAMSLLSINAIDGSIIDPSLGY